MNDENVDGEIMASNNNNNNKVTQKKVSNTTQ